ncbi:hypothetical protein [Streptomyces mimosae]|uniref:hypothetical protein n=1 Tax=Streptomyces mimosae TaxID=2586635 RepID=UPI001D054282|nr:hypothetical protein [Streptomyces mimosae]
MRLPARWFGGRGLKPPTEWRRGEGALRFRHTLEFSPDGDCLTDLAGQVTLDPERGFRRRGR